MKERGAIHSACQTAIAHSGHHDIVRVAQALTPDLIAGGYSIKVKELRGIFTEADDIAEARKIVRNVIRLPLAVSKSLAQEGTHPKG